MHIAVVIPHLNQVDSLRAGLAALHSQADSQNPSEIVVVDNGSTHVPIEVCSRWPKVRLVSEPEPGPGPARNRGVREVSHADVIAFIDADCIADPRWMATIESAFSDTATQIVGGAVRVAYRDATHPTTIEPYEAIYSYRNHEHIAEGFSGTGNLAVRPNTLDLVGPFAGIEVAEDRDWGFRARERGIAITYVDDMIVYHPARDSFAELEQKWDRHIAHDYRHYAVGRWGRSKWLIRALAVTISPVAELPTIARSDQVTGVRERLLAFYGLVRVRSYRGWRMWRIVNGASTRSVERMHQSWNRPAS